MSHIAYLLMLRNREGKDGNYKRKDRKGCLIVKCVYSKGPVKGVLTTNSDLQNASNAAKNGIV